MIKLYPGGQFSGLLADGDDQAGDELEVTGPYGVFTLRAELAAAAGVHRRRRRDGADPVAAALDGARPGSERAAVYYYGARTRGDLFHLDELEALAAELPDFRFVPALSEDDGDGWDGETGLITEVVDRLEGDVSEVDAYLCGPPPMVDAAIAMLEAKGVPEAHIYFDKFTTTADE